MKTFKETIVTLDDGNRIRIESPLYEDQERTAFSVRVVVDKDSREVVVSYGDSVVVIIPTIADDPNPRKLVVYAGSAPDTEPLII